VAAKETTDAHHWFNFEQSAQVVSIFYPQQLGYLIFICFLCTAATRLRARQLKDFFQVRQGRA
jgi:hypothetical protein